MTGPVVIVKTGETSQSGGISLSNGTAFVVAPAAYGPEEPRLVRSLGEAVTLYGPRTEAESQKLYDALNTFFALGGSRAWVNRIAGEGSPVAAKLELEAGATAKTLVATAKYKGTYGNSLKVEVVENAGKTASKLVILNPEGEALESSPEFALASEVLTWGASHETYVTLSQGSGYTAGKGSVLKVLASTKLATGANPTVNEKTTIKSIEGFARALGAGQLIVPGNTEEKVHVAMAEHCLTTKRNRFAIPDIKKAEETGSTVANITGEKGTFTLEQSKKCLFVSSSAIVQGVALGTTRTVPASAVVAALCARVSATGNDNQAPAGETFSLAPYVLGFTNTFNQEQIEELSTAGINSFKEVQGIPCLFGFVTACSREKDIIFWQASASREQMALVARCEEVGQPYLFKTITKRTIAKFQAGLQGVGKEHVESEALDAFAVNVAAPINTPTTEANGELNAEMVVQIGPYANVVNVSLTAAPVTETIS